MTKRCLRLFRCKSDYDRRVEVCETHPRSCWRAFRSKVKRTWVKAGLRKYYICIGKGVIELGQDPRGWAAMGLASLHQHHQQRPMRSYRRSLLVRRDNPAHREGPLMRRSRQIQFRCSDCIKAAMRSPSRGWRCVCCGERLAPVCPEPQASPGVLHNAAEGITKSIWV